MLLYIYIYPKISNKGPFSKKRPPSYLDSKNDHFLDISQQKNAHWKTMGQNDLTFWSMFANSLFNRLTKEYVCFYFHIKPNKL